MKKTTLVSIALGLGPVLVAAACSHDVVCTVQMIDEDGRVLYVESDTLSGLPAGQNAECTSTVRGDSVGGDPRPSEDSAKVAGGAFVVDSVGGDGRPY